MLVEVRGSEARGVGREAGVEAGRSNWAVRSVKRSLQRGHVERVTGDQEGAELPVRAKAREGAWELGAGAEGRSGVGGVERAEGSHGYGEASSARSAGNGK